MSAEPENPNQCRHLSPRGQRCRMLRASNDESLCSYHLRLTAASQPAPEALAAELLESTGNLNTADRVNALLANAVKQLAHKRIDRRDALAIGYLAQLLLNTVPGVQKEYQAVHTSQARQALRKSITDSKAPRLHAPQPTPEPTPEPPAQPTAHRAIPVHRPSFSLDEPDEVLLETVLQATTPLRL